MFKLCTVIALSLLVGTAQAQQAQNADSAEKQKLIQQVLHLWHVENIGLSMLQEPVAESLRQARSLMQGRASAERQAAAMKEINEDAKKFLEETTPIVTANAEKLVPTTVAPLLAEKFTTEELRQIVAILESPVKAKFEALVPEMQKTLGEKIAAQSAAQINPKLETLKQQIGARMRVAITP